MPKVVDHDVRRREIGTAVLNVIATDGLERLTVRKIAAESGWSTGVLTHYVRDKDELIALAVETMAQRFVGRLQAIRWDAPSDALRLALRELLPLDADRHVETLVWFRLATHNAQDTGASATIRRGHRELRKLIAGAVAAAGPETDRTCDELAIELVALADGLAVHHLIDPRGMPRTRIAAALDTRLAELIR